jgi:hypothetical protein
MADAAAGSFERTAGHAKAGRKASGLVALRPKLDRLLDWLVAFWIFTGGMVIVEPSPYEVSFLLVLPIALLAGFGLHRSMSGLLMLFVAFIPFALIGAFQSRHIETSDAIIFVMVTIFLVLTSFFAANYVADAPVKRMRLIMTAYTVTAVISAIIGTLGYLGVIPGHDLFTKFGRAKAFFNDPNVFGPFLILPAMYALQRILLSTGKRAFWGAVIFMVLFVGVFASFSRAAWGHLGFSAIIVFLLCFWLEAHAKAKVRMLLLTMAGVLLLGISLAGLLSIPAVQQLFEVRAASQNYDSGETGRFGRQGYAFELALANPWGIGPLEFRNLRVIEEPHDSYVNFIHVYGWGGGFVYFVLVIWTIWRGIAGLFRPGPNRLLLIPLMAVFVPLVGEAAIIDTDHWRHYFLVVGLIWGVTAVKQKIKLSDAERQAALV